MINFFVICFLLGYVFGGWAVIAYILARALAFVLSDLSAKK